ncbi:MAG: hypothetical protein O9346_11205 [Leptospiraceae bacterium]|jgi:hypothetical protein|nr:hypothetical protein [Leptospiraceae bacterium]
MNQSKVFIAIFLCYITCMNIFAGTSAFEKNQWLFEIQGGSLQSKVSDDASPERFTTLFYLYDVAPLVLSSNPERRNLGIAKALDYKESEIINQNLRWGVEYGILSWLGIGGSLTRSNTRVTNVLPGDYLVLASFGVPVPNPREDLPELTNFGTFFPRTLNASIASAELEASLHLPFNIYDFYLRGGLGQIWDGGSGRKESLSLGTRVLIENIAVSFELYRSSIFADFGRTDFLREEGFRLGAGYRYLP